MKKRDSQEKYGFFYDEEGTNEVSQQIMDSYNSGVIGESNTDAQVEGKTEY
jgi:hypothetical protein